MRLILTYGFLLMLGLSICADADIPSTSNMNSDSQHFHNPSLVQFDEVQGACCDDDGICTVTFEVDCIGDWLSETESCDPNPCNHHLYGGALIVHSPPGIDWTSDIGWCQRYYDEFAITSAEQQVSRVDPGAGEPVIWYILAAWEEPRRFCGFSFGFGDYDPDVMVFEDWSPCYPVDGLEIPSSNWPGPNDGVAVTTMSSSWYGNYIPLYYFGGYSYVAGQIPLSTNPITGLASFGTCDQQVDEYEVNCLGALGVNTDGVDCFPASVPIRACCIGYDCYLMIETDCASSAGEWMPLFESCSPNPCPQPFGACCYNDGHCEYVEEADCNDEWTEAQTCDPNLCEQPAGSCCYEEGYCLYILEADCPAEWTMFDLCEPNPCPQPHRACCDEMGVCTVTSEEECNLPSTWLPEFESCDPYPCELSLEGGVLIAHSPPGIEWTIGYDWCQRYYDEFSITGATEQVSRVDPEVDTAFVWYVLAAWDDDRQFCGSCFGFGDYDPQIMTYEEWGPCYPSLGLEIPSDNWPGPNEGVAVVITDQAWHGSYVPIYWFGGYSYGSGQIQLTANPMTENARIGTCGSPAIEYDISCLGALGVNTDGVNCFPPSTLFACCTGQGCSLQTASDCASSSGQWKPMIDSCDPDPCDYLDVADEITPIRTTLMHPQPNPFSGGTIIRYSLAEAGLLELNLYDASGRLIRELFHGGAEPGAGNVEWNGCDELGRPVRPGVYFCLMNIGSHKESTRVLIIR